MSKVKSRASLSKVCRRARRLDQRGISLVESIVGMVITIITVVGLAHLFGNGRALINHHEVARAAYAVAQQRLELLARTASMGDLTVGTHPDTLLPFVYEGASRGSENWVVVWFDDPLDGQGAGDLNPNDLKRVTVTVAWGQGTAKDTVRVTRFFPAG